ncbi:DNA recombination protein RmuC [Paracoccus sp. S-4012]|nr:DNA recombination protein RmuC [Paracoccus sp. S-4012]
MPVLLVLTGAAAAILTLLSLWRRAAAARDGALAAAQAAEARFADSAARREAETMRATAAETRAEAQAARLEELRVEAEGLTDALNGARAEAAESARQLAEVRIAAAKDREAAAREIETLRGLREEMTAQFKALSTETLRLQAEDTKRSQNETLTSLLTPFREQVHRFQTELQTRETEAGKERERLAAQIEFLHKRSEEIGREAVALTRALKGEKQAQGAWGEMILHRLLEDSGLEEGTHYTIHEKRHDEAGRRFHPDVVVRMPRGRQVVVDSKCSLIAYEAAANAEDEAVRAAALADHVRAVRAHITALSAKAYDSLDSQSLDYVVMFIPIEGAFADALRADRDLPGFAMSRRIVLSPPTNLMLMLRTIEHIWTVEKRESNAAEIAARAGRLYDKVAGFVASMEDAGRAIGKAAEAHEKAMGQLSRGSGNVIRQVEQLRELGARATKRIELDHDRADAEPRRLTAEA